MNAATSGTRLVYQTNVLTQPVRISGTPWLSLRMAFSKPKANLTGILISYPGAGGNGTILSRGWLDPENRTSDRVSEPIVPGQFYRLNFDLQPKDMVVPAGRRLAFMILSSDFEHTLRPAPGTQLTLDTAQSSVSLPIVGGAPALAAATGTGYVEAPVSATVPATLSLTLGPAATLRRVHAGGHERLHGDDDRQRDLHRRRCRADRDDPGPLANGTFTLPEPLRVDIAPAVWTAPVSNAPVAVTFKQLVKATDALRTGAYARAVTFTLSTTSP